MLVMLLAVLVPSGCLGGGRSYVLSGTVIDSKEDGLPEVKLMITGGTKITKASSELSFERISNKILWYVFQDPEHQFRSVYPISPPDNLTDIKYEIVVENEMLTEVPSGCEVLVLSDTGAGFDLSEFSGRIIVTLDGGVAPLMYWMTGANQQGVYWNFPFEEELKWARPIAGSEVWAGEDAHILHIT
jgi:hypothetical protein